MRVLRRRVVTILLGCIFLYLCKYGVAQHQDDGDNGIEMVKVLEPIIWCDVEYVKVCKWWDTLVETKIYACRTVPRTVCVTGFQKITLVFSLETESERKQRIVEDIEEFVTTTAKNLQKLCAAQAGSSSDPSNEDEEETNRNAVPDAVCLIIRNRWNVLTHKVHSVGHKHLQGDYGTDFAEDVLGEWEPFTSGSSRYARIWLDVTEHEKNYRDDEDRDEQIVMSLIHERAHTEDRLKDGVENINDNQAENIAWEVHHVIGNSGVNWEPQRNKLLGVLPGWNHDEEDYEQDSE